jgi:hypothetical protein
VRDRPAAPEVTQAHRVVRVDEDARAGPRRTGGAVGHWTSPSASGKH